MNNKNNSPSKTLHQQLNEAEKERMSIAKQLEIIQKKEDALKKKEMDLKEKEKEMEEKFKKPTLDFFSRVHEFKARLKQRTDTPETNAETEVVPGTQLVHYGLPKRSGSPDNVFKRENEDSVSARSDKVFTTVSKCLSKIH